MNGPGMILSLELSWPEGEVGDMEILLPMLLLIALLCLVPGLDGAPIPKRSERPEGSGSQRLETTGTEVHHTPTTTAFWRLRNDKIATIVLHKDTTTTQETTTQEVPQNGITLSVTEEPVISILPQKVEVSFETSPSRPQSDIHGTIILRPDTPAVAEVVSPKVTHHVMSASVAIYSSHSEKPPKNNNIAIVKTNHFTWNHKSSRGDIMGLIDVLTKMLRNTPVVVKIDPDFNTKLENVKDYLREMLALVKNAENKLVKGFKQKQEEVANDTIVPSPPATTVSLTIHVETPTTPDSTDLKLAQLQMELAKLKSFLRVLDHFTARLSSFVRNSPNRKASKEIVDKAIAILKTIKAVFCENPNRQTQQVLKDLIDKEMQLLKQAKREARVL
ncbi:uncharacterized protein LOC100566389 isoform X2 [Anolis carolinensis]|uniref:uncharacterized protein LOC100566389 isoform X2 n=1 Tax=Anolis carolinensis TaxID=28377 RepID=UPI002F2B496A